MRKKKEAKRVAESIREREAATATANLRRARNREHTKARSRAKKKKAKIAAERIREREAATTAADLRRARNREHKARSLPEKERSYPLSLYPIFATINCAKRSKTPRRILRRGHQRSQRGHP